jgi:hypothetical protein
MDEQSYHDRMRQLGPSRTHQTADYAGGFSECKGKAVAIAAEANAALAAAREEVARVKKELADERGWNERRKAVWNRIGAALEPRREKRSTGEPSRNDADEVEALCARIAGLEAVVGRLPVDAEGNPVVPHANLLFYPRHGRVWPCAWDYRLSNGCWLAAFGCDEEGMVLVQIDRTYRDYDAAAQAAQRGEGRDG